MNESTGRPLAVVTGASSGIGYELTKLCAENGFDLVVAADTPLAEAVEGGVVSGWQKIPPYATLSVLWERQAKGKEPTREELLRKYESDYAETADKMIRQLRTYAPG